MYQDINDRYGYPAGKKQHRSAIVRNRRTANV
jgi:hypothetical protein